MRWTPLLLVVMVWGCSRVQNDFRVEGQRQLASSATLSLCGSEMALEREGAHFIGSRVIDCEGSGHIRLRYKDGKVVDCPVGYVTPGSELDYRFRAEPSYCQ